MGTDLGAIVLEGRHEIAGVNELRFSRAFWGLLQWGLREDQVANHCLELLYVKQSNEAISDGDCNTLSLIYTTPRLSDLNSRSICTQWALDCFLLVELWT